MTSQQPPPDRHMIQFFNEKALFWTRFADVPSTFPALDALLEQLRPSLIAPAHGGIVDTPERMVPVFKDGMLVG